MDPLQLQMLLKMIEEEEMRKSMSPSHEPNLTNPNLLGGSNAKIGPNSSPTMNLSRVLGAGRAAFEGGYPNEMGVVGNVTAPSSPMRPPIRPTMIGPNRELASQVGGYPNEMGTIATETRMGRPMVETPSQFRYGSYNKAPSLPQEALPVSPTQSVDIPVDTSVTSPAVNAPIENASQAAPQSSGKELPYQTYQRITGSNWTGGKSNIIQELLRRYGITSAPGSAQANIALQRALMNDESLMASNPQV